MFDTLSDRLDKVFKSIRGKGRLSEADIDATTREIRIALLEADVALPVVRTFVAAVKSRALGAEVSQALNPAQQIIKIVNEELITVLGGDTRLLQFAKQPPTVIMLAGLQGAGKTTLAGKLALLAEDQQPRAAAGRLRPAAAQRRAAAAGRRWPGGCRRLRTRARQRRRRPGRRGAPRHRARQALGPQRRHRRHRRPPRHRRRHDGAGCDIRDAVSPDEILFVVDAMVGQDAVVTAQAFLDGVGFTGVVLTKLDGDARGGAALSVAQLTGRSIMFASTGEKLADFDVFHPERMASRILGMGDVLTLIEQAEQHFDQEQSEKLADKLMGDGDFTLEDFLDQMLTIRKMGPISGLLGMLPGMGQMKDALAQVNDGDIDRITAIIRSMTPAERADAKIINGSRRARISAGAGVTVAEVNSLVDRFFEARKMMKSMAGGIPGMPGMGKRKGGGGKSARTPKAAKKGKGAQRSGRPGAPAPVRQSAQPPQLPPGMPQLPPGFQMPDLSSLRKPDHPR